MSDDQNSSGTTSEPPIREIPPDAGTDFRPDGQFYRIEADWVQLSRVGGVLGALLLSGGLAIPAFGLFLSRPSTSLPLPLPLPWLAVLLWALVSLVSLVRAMAWPAFAYRRYLFRADATRLQIRRGMLWREVLDIPRNRIQHTDVAQGPLERAFGLFHLIVHTAGTRNAAVRLEGLHEEIAYRIRNELLETRSDDAV